ncbi:MAG TPA: hypothetical protein VK974_09645 [Methylophilaceae bacterium]|nr:hypothetical protein [Methylophilaceae bacterium]
MTILLIVARPINNADRDNSVHHGPINPDQKDKLRSLVKQAAR